MISKKEEKIIMLKKLKNILKDKPYIRFHADKTTLDIAHRPDRAGKFVPKWFKKLDKRMPNTSATEPGTIKACVPFVEAMTEGYIIPLWADLHVKVVSVVKVYDVNQNFITEIPWQGNPQGAVGKRVNDWEGRPIITRVEATDKKKIELHMAHGQTETPYHEFGQHSFEQVGELCDIKKFTLGKTLMKFHCPWIIDTPEGWSVRIKNPSNNWENDIHLIEGVVDSDTYYGEINLPFVWTGSEECDIIIPAGTPLAHVIPYKRQPAMELEIGLTCEKKKAVV